MRSFLIFLSFVWVSNTVFAQSCENMAIELTAIPSTTPVQITLKWKPVGFGTPTYRIWKKAKSATAWGFAIATLPSTDTDYVDNAVIVDSAYEYLVQGAGSITSVGYIYAGIKAPATHNRGPIILVVDSTFTVPCAAGIKKLMDDLSGDGWEVIRHDFLRTKTDVAIKAVIANDYATHANVNAVLLLGHVAVPYSGDLNPDAHPDHLGAWPADVYYASLSGSWTDATVNDVSAGYAANRNTPGDGKFDQTALPAETTLQVSRVDFYDMPAFSLTEVQMMDNYLSKDHVYKMDSLSVLHKALISDNFGYFSGEAFASTGWRNFPTLVGRDSIFTTTALITDLAASPYQWAYGCGGGSFTSASGIGNTGNFASNAGNGIFNIYFGSYFGDWNVTNNFLRAPLCQNPPALTNCWAGRPHWFFHHMALGDNIGYSARVSQNNTTLYVLPVNYYAGWVHSALMGDLSLRTDYIKPVISINAASSSFGGATVNWMPSPDPDVIGYYVYRADSAYGYYKRLNTTMITGSTYNDFTPTTGLKYYMVRPVKLESTPSGGYYNLGVGITDTAMVTRSVLQTGELKSTAEVSLFPNPVAEQLNVVVNANEAEVIVMYVVDVTGRVSDIVTRQIQNGENRFMLNTVKYVPGMYMLVVKEGDNQIVKQWIKN